MKPAIAAAILCMASGYGFAHRLDEYLQNTIVSVDPARVHAQVFLTPGVAVFPLIVARIDTDRNGAISAAEQRAYAGRVLRDLSLAVGGERLRPRLVSWRFPPTAEMREGRGEIEVEFEAELPPGGGSRKLTIENRHESRISAYQVNCLVPDDPRIRVAAQRRNYTQSVYELDYEDTGGRDESLFVSGLSRRLLWLSPIALLLSVRLTMLWRQRQRDGASPEE